MQRPMCTGTTVVSGRRPCAGWCVRTTWGVSGSVPGRNPRRPRAERGSRRRQWAWQVATPKTRLGDTEVARLVRPARPASTPTRRRTHRPPLPRPAGCACRIHENHDSALIDSRLPPWARRPTMAASRPNRPGRPSCQAPAAGLRVGGLAFPEGRRRATRGRRGGLPVCATGRLAGPRCAGGAGFGRRTGCGDPLHPHAAVAPGVDARSGGRFSGGAAGLE
jgi:hypothetical protein